MVRKRFAVAAVVPAFLTLAALAGPVQTDESAAAKALREKPELKKQLETPVFDELKDALPHAEVNGTTYWYAEGDLALDEAELRFYAKRRETQRLIFETGEGGDPSGETLLSMTVNGKIVRWAPGSTVTYCILKSTFTPAEYAQTVANMTAAANDWMANCGVKLQHKVALDTTPGGVVLPAGVTFAVAKFDLPGGTIAQAFFPPDPRNRHFLLIDPSYFDPGLSFNKVGVLRHETGHVLGFRHEHIRSEAPPACQGESTKDTFKLTNYDPRSVMHYFCGGFGSLQLAITAKDKAGSQVLYGGPGGMSPPIPPASDPRFRNFTP